MAIFNAKFGATFTKNENTVISLSRDGEFILDGYPNIIRMSQTEPVAVLEAGLPVGAFKVYETLAQLKLMRNLQTINKWYQQHKRIRYQISMEMVN